MNHNTLIKLLDYPFQSSDLPPVSMDNNTGCTVEFRGIVRGEEDGKQISGLDYECFEPMAKQEFERLCRETLERWPLLGIEVCHSVGFVPVGRVSFFLRVSAVHRKEAIAAIDFFVDAMKQRVPIWKHPRFDGEPSHKRKSG